jgi:hypothetical protein
LGLTTRKWKGATQLDLIIEVWEELDCESVGVVELEQIQQALRERFGDGGVPSPAAIARTVADEGAVLRHPEVFECDLKWRESEINDGLSANELDFSTLEDAANSISKIEAARRCFQNQGNDRAVHRTRELALRCKQEAQLIARSGVVEPEKQLAAREIVQWLTVWLQEPELFEDWLSLRRRSAPYLKAFQHMK